ncbi:hypothetical protein BaRGS_00020591, partial [Batillaria attramentaria]
GGSDSTDGYYSSGGGGRGSALGDSPPRPSSAHSGGTSSPPLHIKQSPTPQLRHKSISDSSNAQAFHQGSLFLRLESSRGSSSRNDEYCGTWADRPWKLSDSAWRISFNSSFRAGVTHACRNPQLVDDYHGEKVGLDGRQAGLAGVGVGPCGDDLAITDIINRFVNCCHTAPKKRKRLLNTASFPAVFPSIVVRGSQQGSGREEIAERDFGDT